MTDNRSEKLVINTYKPIGKTSLDVIKQLKKVDKNLTNKKIGYAGRLDPMAEGVIILLVEPETKKRNKYQNLDKEYEFEILFGIETDSLDILGLINKTSSQKIDIANLETIVNNFPSKLELPFPHFSSKTVKGKPLYWWTRKNKLDEIGIPVKTTKINSLKFLAARKIKKDRLRNQVIKKVKSVDGDFRQEKIIECWEDFFDKTPHATFVIVKLVAHVSSGTYIRSLAKKIANDINTAGTAFSIKRTKVGNYNINESNSLFNQKQ